MGNGFMENNTELSLKEKAKNIEVLAIDIDGTLTDGIYQVTQNGEIIKSFHTRDFHWIGELLNRDEDIMVCIVTNSTDDCMAQKILQLPYKDNSRFIIWTGIEDKKKYINASFSWNEVAYIGDGMNDLESMKLAAITGCPLDAEDEIKEESHFISKYNGGRGAVAEFIKYLISLREDKNV